MMELLKYCEFSINPEKFMLEQNKVFSGIKMAFETTSFDKILKYKIPEKTNPIINNNNEIVFKSNKLALPPRLSEGGRQCNFFQRMPYSVIKDKPLGTIGRPPGNGKLEGIAKIKPNKYGFDILLEFELDDRIKSNILYLSNIPKDVEIIIPADGGISLKDIPEGVLNIYEYPVACELVHQFIIFNWDDKGFWIYCDNYPITRKRLVISSVDKIDGISISFISEAKMPYKNRFQSPEFHIESFSGGWKTPAARYKKMLEEKLGLKKFEERNDFPIWAKDISLFVEARGLNWGGYITHTFNNMKDRLEEISKLINPKNVLFYISGWDDWYDIANVEFTPSNDLGGLQGFKDMVSYGHKLGFRLCLYINAIAINLKHPLWERFKDHQVCNSNNRPLGWMIDYDGDGIREELTGYISLDCREWRELVVATVKRICFEYNCDAIFFDQLCQFWDKEGEDLNRGTELLLKQLRAELPKDFLITAEETSEHFIKDIAMANEFQHHIPYPYTNTGPIEYWKYPCYMRFHPVVKYVINDYTHSFGHVCAGEPGYDLLDYRTRYNKEFGALPTMVLPHFSKKIIEFPQLIRIVDRAIDISNGKEELKFDD